MTKKVYLSFEEDGQKFMQCKRCGFYVEVSMETVAITCSRCVAIRSIQLNPELIPELRDKPSGRPPGWHFMTVYVDKDGTVFHKGEEQPDLKGTLKPTKVKKKKPIKKKTLLQKNEEDTAKMLKLAKTHKKKQKTKRKGK